MPSREKGNNFQVTAKQHSKSCLWTKHKEEQRGKAHLIYKVSVKYSVRIFGTIEAVFTKPKMYLTIFLTFYNVLTASRGKERATDVAYLDLYKPFDSSTQHAGI